MAIQEAGIGSRLTAEVAAGLLDSGHTLAALELAIGRSPLFDEVTAAVRSDGLLSDIGADRGVTVTEARLTAIGLASIAQRAYYQGDPALGAEFGRRAANELQLEHGDDLAAELRYSHALFTLQADRSADAESLFRALSTDAESPDGRARRLSLRGAGFLAFHSGRWQAAMVAFTDSALEHGDVVTDRLAATAMQAVVHLRRSLGPRAAREAASLVQAGGGEPTTRWAQALIAEASGDTVAALAGARDVMAAVREEAPVRLRFFAPDIVRIAMASGDASLADEAAARLEDVARRASIPSITGAWYLCSGIVRRAPDQLVESVRLLTESPRRTLHAYACEAAGTSLMRSGKLRDGGQLLTTAWREYGTFGAERDAARVREMLERAGVRLPQTATRAGRRASGWASLSTRERSVARLVAQGLTNREIALLLSISTRTVDTHVEHLFAKLGVSRRAAIASEAVLREPSPSEADPRWVAITASRSGPGPRT